MSLRSDSLAFLVGVTRRREIESALGPAITYPAPGWQTWTIAGIRGQAWILSAFYRKDDVLLAVEHYLTKTDKVPADAPRIKGIFKLMPADRGLGNAMKPVPPFFVARAGRVGGVAAFVYEHGLEARWTGGLALISGNDQRIERLALYGAG